MKLTFILGFMFCACTLPEYNYPQVLDHLQQKKNTLMNRPEALKKSSDLLFHYMTDSVFPSWYGTTWDFNGTSNVPGEGMIACGYFVSTTLKHCHFNLNRYKLAQQAASIIVKEICGHATWFASKADILKHVKAKKDGLYVVGLDYHVGFLAVEEGEAYFIHSDYFNGKVVKEKCADSQGFGATDRYVLGSISRNDGLMKKWMNNTKIY